MEGKVQIEQIEKNQQNGRFKYNHVNNNNVDGLHIPIKRQRLSNWVKRQTTTICYLKETHLQYKVKNRFKIKGRQKDIPCKH